MTILSVPIDIVTMEESVQKIKEMYHESGLHLVATANAEMLMRARHDTELHTILNKASLVIPDGAGVLWAAEQEGKAFPERVAGCDLAKRLIEEAATDGTPIYCLGAEEGVAQQALDNLSAEYGPLHIVGVHSGYFTDEEEKQILEAIKSGGAKLVLVALGVPKQEKWIATKLATLDGVVAIGVGGSFDVLAGHVQRAPEWMQRNRLEWLYRLLKQPQRIGRMLALPKFMLAVWQDRK